MHLVQLDSLSQLNFAIVSSRRSDLFVVFNAVWGKRLRDKRTFSDLILKLNYLGVDVVYVVSSIGNDDVERHVVDVLHVTSLPVLCRYKCDEGNIAEPNWMGYSISDPFPDPFPEPNRRTSSVIENPAAFDAALHSLLHDPIVPNFGTLFVAGDKSSVGKSTTCLAIMAAMLRLGLLPEDIAYIKPVTQCEAEQLVTRFCQQRGIACIGVGPVVFYKGFTRAFLEGETEPSHVLLQRAVAAVRQIAQGKKLVLVDGVGYPAVGSICGVSNADVARALDAPVLLVGKSGVGDAVDSFNLNAAFFQLSGVTVLGGVFNKLATDGFYSRDHCAEAVGKYFQQYRPCMSAYGFLPLVPAATIESSPASSDAHASDRFLFQLTESFMEYVHVRELLVDLWTYSKGRRAERLPAADIPILPTTEPGHRIERPSKIPRLEIPRAPPPFLPSATSVPAKRSREDIEAMAQSNGAMGG